MKEDRCHGWGLTKKEELSHLGHIENTDGFTFICQCPNDESFTGVRRIYEYQAREDSLMHYRDVRSLYEPSFHVTGRGWK